MVDQRKAETMKLSGNDYAKVAERLKLFRQDFQKSKIETAHQYLDDGTVEFKAWLWKDKAEYIDLVKSGVTDMAVLRSTADADGDAKGQTGVKQKDFEKLQTIATGRALANLGYLGSGEIASFEEMEEFNQYKEKLVQDEIEEAIQKLNEAKSNEELNAIVQSIGNVLRYQPVIDAGKAKRAELTKAAAKVAKPVKAEPEASQEPADANN